jgi:hypothetical protein
MWVEMMILKIVREEEDNGEKAGGFQATHKRVRDQPWDKCVCMCVEGGSVCEREQAGERRG